ncbi:ComEC/Rec2 family competence protein [Bacillus alkalicellulosilyticus]|uniref:ComEC/Rec2 family competence protein n=1 Tax=Alkalihalobacterium alkalicellulosilyticum TaxID=1912214 RepID=UPI00099822C4|nr:hypothetical protein [Bacillus alkalicellulosilyticus]
MRMVLLGLACFFGMLLFGCSTVEVSSSIKEDLHFEVDLNLKKDEIAFTYFDLPSGEATLIQSGSGGTVLIGTGARSSQIELAKRLHMFHVDELNTVILVNDDDPYSGNIDWLVSHYPIETIVVPPTLKSVIANKYQIPVDKLMTWEVGKQKDILPSLQTEVLYTGEQDYDDFSSFVLSFTYGQFKTLYMGVANEKVEEKLLNDYALKSAVLKVADFASERGTTQPFLNEVDPQVAIVFQREGQLPSEYVLDRLQETWIDIYQTNKMGTVSIRSTLENYEIMTVHANEEEFPSIISK